MERIDPITIKFEDGETYTLEFNRKTVKEAEEAGFRREDAGDKLMTRIPELFYYAFRMHHPNLRKPQTDSILFNDLGGLTDEMIERLIDLFAAPYTTLVNENGTPKNPKVTVTL